MAYKNIGGWGEIRTHGRLAPSPVFKTGALNHSATHPARLFNHIARPEPSRHPQLRPRCHRARVDRQDHRAWNKVKNKAAACMRARYGTDVSAMVKHCMKPKIIFHIG